MKKNTLITNSIVNRMRQMSCVVEEPFFRLEFISATKLLGNNRFLHENKHSSENTVDCWTVANPLTQQQTAPRVNNYYIHYVFY